MSSLRVRARLLAAIAVVALAPKGTLAEPLALDRFLADVEAKNPGIRAAREHGAALSSRVRPAGAPEDPFFAAGPDGISSDNSGAELIRYQLSQTLPIPGRLGARTAAAEERATAAAADAQTVTRTTVVVATQAFYRAFHNQRALELNDDLARFVDDAIQSGRSRYRTGSAVHHEWLLAKADLAILATERVRLENEATVLRAELNELRGSAPDTPIDSLVASFERPDDSAPPSGEAASASPEQRSLDATVRAAQADRKLASLAVVPDVVVQGMLEDPRDSMESKMWGVMVGVTVPVYWPWKQRDLVTAAERELHAAEANAAALANRLAAEEATARAALHNAHRTVELYDKSVIPATELALQSARSGYAVGNVGLRDLIDVARVRRTQQLELLDAKIDVVLARTRLENLLSAPPVLRLAPSTPTLFGAGMSGGAPMSPSMSEPSTIRMGGGIGLGAARGSGADSGEPASGGGMKGM